MGARDGPYGWKTEEGQMLIDLIKEKSGLILSLDLPEYSYIDHASAYHEGYNFEMFESMETLEAFIYNCDSEIVLDNDNR